jgi:hypothetical protein
MLSSCQSQPSLGVAEKACRDTITASLLNPESVEFFEFQESSRDAYRRASVDEQVREVASLRPEASEGLIRSVATQVVSESVSGMPKAKFHSLRVKAEGKLGNKVTSVMQCAVEDTSCRCAAT